LADFENKTGDEVFDRALKQGLAVQLGQSPFLSIFSNSQVQETLKKMNRSPNERLTAEIAREICERRRLKAFITGSIVMLGSSYVLTLEAISGFNGEVLAREQAEAIGKEQVLKALAQAAAKLRESLGESLSSIDQSGTPLADSTTSSLEALRAFSLGTERLNTSEIESIPFYKRAIELDPNFALAYSVLAARYANTGQTNLSVEYATKAYALRDKASVFERLRIEDMYYWVVTREIDRELEVLEIMKRTYPRDRVSPTNLSDVNFYLGQFERALGEAQEAIRRGGSNHAMTQLNLVRALLALNRFDEAKEASRAALQQIDNSAIHLFLYEIAFVYGDSAVMQEQSNWAKGEREEYISLAWQAETESFSGRWQRAQEFSRRSIDLAARVDAKDLAVSYAANAAAFSAIFGQCMQAKRWASQALRLNTTGRPPATALIGLALCEDLSGALQPADEYDKHYPKDTLFNGPWLPTVRGAVELKQGNAARAIELLEAGVPYEGASQFWSPYLRGQAYLKLDRGAEAAAEFQKILDHRGQAPLSALYPLAHLGLARAASLMRDPEKSRKEYETFFSLWKDADADIPILQQAKLEYRKLNS
jgi:tetratricopeptide (TPR) repeat protein